MCACENAYVCVPVKMRMYACAASECATVCVLMHHATCQNVHVCVLHVEVCMLALPESVCMCMCVFLCTKLTEE